MKRGGKVVYLREDMDDRKKLLIESVESFVKSEDISLAMEYIEDQAISFSIRLSDVMKRLEGDQALLEKFTMKTAKYFADKGDKQSANQVLQLAEAFDCKLSPATKRSLERTITVRAMRSKLKRLLRHLP